MGDITQLLDEARAGDTKARDELFTLLYGEFQKLARSRLSQESTQSQLDATALIHEAYLRLTRQGALPGENRRAFLAYASQVMRSVIVDTVRERNARKRGAGEHDLTLTTGVAGATFSAPEIESLDAALSQLATLDERAHRVVEMRYFGGLAIEEIAAVLDVAPATVKRDWQKARAYLFKAMQA